jgi:hypothetical protein
MGARSDLIRNTCKKGNMVPISPLRSRQISVTESYFAPAFQKQGASMSVIESTPEQSGIPVVPCPSCGERMALSTIVPGEDNREYTTFKCECGMDYSQARPIISDRGL